MLSGRMLAASLKLNQALGTYSQKPSHTSAQGPSTSVSRSGLQSGRSGCPNGLLIPEEHASQGRWALCVISFDPVGLDTELTGLLWGIPRDEKGSCHPNAP